VGRFAERQPAEVAQLHDTALSDVEFGQLFQQIIERKNVRVRRWGVKHQTIEIHLHPTPRPLVHLSPSCVVDEDSPHEPGGEGEEMDAVLPGHSALVDETEERFVNERRRLQRVVAALVTQVQGSATAKLLVQHRHQLVAGFLIAIAPGPK
jgi:hypothetical protein